MVRCQISANICHFLPVVWNHVPPYFSHLHLVLSNCLTYFTFVSSVFSRCSTYCIFFAIRLSSDLQSMSFSSVFFLYKGFLCSKVHFRGLDLTSYPLGMILWQLFSCKFMQFYFFYNSLFPGNCRPGWTIYTEKCPYLFRIDSIWFNRFHHFSIGFTQVSNLFQPFAVGSNQCLAYYGLCHCFFTGFQHFFTLLLPWVVISCSIYFISFSIDFH